MKGIIRTAGILSLLCQSTNAVELTVGNSQSVKSAASEIAFGLMKYYTGNNTGDTPGNLPDPYFWWEAGAMFGTLVDYWALTGDDTYNAVVSQALLSQVGDDKDYMPQNQTRSEGNDDQGFWAMAAMSAAENRFPDPPPDQPQWLALAQAVFNEYTMRWDEQTCNGGLRWQIFTFNLGFNYKNSISNGCFFNLAARLARFTGNTTYSDWATKVFDWEVGVGFITPDFRILDGAGVDNEDNCTKPDSIQWTYNAGIYLYGSAVMYNITSGAEQETWKERMTGILNETTANFFNGTTGIMQEQACESVVLCDNDQQSFKGYLARWMAGTTQVAPFTFDTVMPLLKTTAAGAAKACTGSPASGFKGNAGTACGFKWTEGTFDGLVGVGEQMNALSAVMYTLVEKVGTATTGTSGGDSGNASDPGSGGGSSFVPVTANSGGTSKGDPNAGIPKDETTIKNLTPITTQDKVAASFLTVAIALSVVGGGVFVLSGGP